MHNYEKVFEAAPQAREGILTINGKSNRAPTHLVNLTRKTDPDRVVDTIAELNEAGEELLPHISGFLIESQLTPTVLDEVESTSQTDLQGDTKFSNIFSVIDKLDRWLIVDPNTDRIFYSVYREKLEDLQGRVPEQFFDIKDALDRDEDDEEDPGEVLEHEDVYSILEQRVSSEEMAESFIGIELDYGSDLIVPPYYPIDLETYENDLRLNFELYEQAQQVDASGTLPTSIVIALKNSVIGAESQRNNGRRQPPQAWIDIIQQYRKAAPDIIFLKATNFSMDPDTLHKREYEGILEFFKLLRRFTNTPVVFLGLDEFAYILMAEGLDGYSHPLYKSPYRMPVRSQNNNHSMHRRFLVPRKWGWTKFDQLASLGCNCMFCEEFNDIHPSQIDIPDQDQLRNQHWLLLRDEELQELHEAIRKDEMRPGLQSICGDSEWKKNFNTFL